VNEEALAHWGLSRQIQTKNISFYEVLPWWTGNKQDYCNILSGSLTVFIQLQQEIVSTNVYLNLKQTKFLYCCTVHFEDSLSIAHQQMH
jgi:hypothetical protein